MPDMGTPETPTTGQGPDLAGTTPPAERPVISDIMPGHTSTGEVLVKIPVSGVSRREPVSSQIAEMGVEARNAANTARIEGTDWLANVKPDEPVVDPNVIPQREQIVAKPRKQSIGDRLRNAGRKIGEAGNNMFRPGNRRFAEVAAGSQAIVVRDGQAYDPLDDRMSRMQAGGVAHPPRWKLPHVPRPHIPRGARARAAAAIFAAGLVIAGVAGTLQGNDRNRIVAIPPPTPGATGTPEPGPTPTPIPEPSGSQPPETPVPTGTPFPSESPSATPTGSDGPPPSEPPSEPPTPAVTGSPEATPTLNPDEQLRKEMDDYISGKTRLPKVDGRYYLYNLSGEPPAIANVDIGSVNTDYTKPFEQKYFVGYQIDTRVKKASNGKDYLIAYMVQESVKDKHGKSEQYILSVNLGCTDTDSTEKTSLTIHKGVVTGGSLSNTKDIIYSPADLQTQINNYNKNFVMFPLDYVNDYPLFAVARDQAYLEAQNPIAKDTIEFSKKTLKKPFSRVPQSSLIANNINKLVEDGFSVSDVPMAVQIITQ